MDAYLQALSCEAKSYQKKAFQTLYVGGGTPSLLSVEQLNRLGKLIEKVAGPIEAFTESTCEANPESLTHAKLHLLRQLGFNRVSIGLQSFRDEELKRLGRVHTTQQFRTAYQVARQVGFQNINVDLIAGLPGQHLTHFLDSLHQLIALQPEHISVYGLQIEEGTPFFEQGVVCDQVLMREMLEQTSDLLKKNGYHHYEISNFALPGYESKHNTHYWQNGEYIGLGSSAVSYQQGVRRQNASEVEEYITHIQAQQSPVIFSEKLEGKAKVGEELMLAFRQLDGVELSQEQQTLFGQEIEKHIQNGLLCRVHKKVKLTHEGLFLANEVFRSFVAPFEELCN